MFRNHRMYAITLLSAWVMAAPLAMPLPAERVWSAAAALVPDANLEKVIRSQLKKPEGDLTPEDLQSLSRLLASDGKKTRPIAQLVGLQYAHRMTRLDVSGNQISDVYPISGLKQLAYLDLSDTGSPMCVRLICRS